MPPHGRRTALDYFHLLPEKLRVLVVGGWNTVFGLLAFAVVHSVVGDRGQDSVALVITYFISTTNAFVGYRHGVFRVRGSLLLDYARFSSVYLVGLAVNIVALPLIRQVFDLPALVAQAAFSAVMIVVTYVMHKYFSFRRVAVTGGAAPAPAFIDADTLP